MALPRVGKPTWGSPDLLTAIGRTPHELWDDVGERSQAVTTSLAHRWVHGGCLRGLGQLCPDHLDSGCGILSVETYRGKRCSQAHILCLPRKPGRIGFVVSPFHVADSLKPQGQVR